VIRKCTLGDKNEEREKEIKQEFSQTCDWIKKRLGDKVARVDISNRLSSSPCVLVAAKFGWSANMERLVSIFTVVMIPDFNNYKTQ
jgi:heat shock protein 90kDa beta